MFIGQGGTYGRRRREQAATVSKNRRINQGILDIQNFSLLNLVTDLIHFLVGHFPPLCYTEELPFILYMRGLFRHLENRPWSGNTGTESPACPQQHLLIRCNTQTSWKDGLNSCKVRVRLTCRFGWKGNSIHNIHLLYGLFGKNIIA